MPSVNARFGNQASVLMGDWLYMTAFEVSLKERSLDILDILTELTRKMTEGELIQLTVLGRSDITEETYFDILQRKTAYLFSACCEIGAILAGASRQQREGLRDFGRNLGIAFQLADDVLDFTADKEVLGKASGADLIEGKLTLPLIGLLKVNPGARESIEQIIQSGEYPNGSRRELLKSLKDAGTLDETRRRAHDFAADARKNLAILPENKYRGALEDVPALMIERES
jgi:octaprenyl-diphosphate synthase